MVGIRHLKAASRFAAHRLRRIHPFEVQAVLLNACNLRCSYCTCPEIPTDLMTTEQWKAVIWGLRSFGTMRIKWQGGEPTIRHDFRELCLEVKRAAITCAVTTNGIAIFERPEVIDYLDEVVFSFDSVTPDLHDEVRGRGTHSKVLKAIETALGRRLKVYVNMVVTRKNYHEMEQMLEFCEARGIGMHAQPVSFDWRFGDQDARDLALTQEQVREMHLLMVGWKRQGRGLMFSAQTYQKTADWDDYDSITVKSHGPSSCMAGRSYIDIQPNGDVHPCGVHGADFEPKNIVKDGLEEALLHVRHHNCGDCGMAYLNERKSLFGLDSGAVMEFLRRG